MKVSCLFVASVCVSLLLIISSCTKDDDPPRNKVPKVDAGAGATISLPTNSVTLTGSASDTDGTIVAYVWTQTSGPAASTIVNPGATSTMINGLVEGTYVFQLLATDDDGDSGVDTVTIQVNPPTIQTLTLQPADNPDEVYVYSSSPGVSSSGLDQITIAAWTVSGVDNSWRSFIKFDYSAIPSGATILEAKLSLYAADAPFQGNGVAAHSGTANASYIQRVSSSWSTISINWNNQPSTVTTHQVSIPQSTSAVENNIDIDVTELVKDMISNGNNGFGIRLVNEVTYNARQYASSFDSDASIRPKLVITYQ